MGINSRTRNNISLLKKKNQEEIKNHSGRILLEEKADSRYFKYLNCYSLNDLLAADKNNDNYRQLAADVMKEVMKLDFLQLPFQDIFPLKDFLENHTVFNTSPIPSFLYPDEKNLMRSYVGFSAVEKATNELREPFTQELLDSVLDKISDKEMDKIMESREKFMVDLEDENKLLLDYFTYFIDDWENNGSVHVTDLQKIAQTWNSYFNAQTGFDDQPLVDLLTSFFGNLDKICDTIQERFPDTDPATLGIQTSVVKEAFSKGNWDVEMVGKVMEYFVPKFAVKQKEIEHARKNNLGLGQINYSGGSYSPGNAVMTMNFINQLRRDVMDVGDGKTRFLMDSDEIVECFQNDAVLRSQVVKTVVGTILHEYAHMFSMSAKRSQLDIPFEEWHKVHENTSPEDFCSNYAKTNPAEHYAEAFSHYWKNVLLKNNLTVPNVAIASFIGL